MVDDSVSSGLLHLDVNESKEEASALLDNITLQPWYQDNLSTYAEEDIKQAMLNELHQLQQQHVGTPINKNNLTDKQHRSTEHHRYPLGHLREIFLIIFFEDNIEGSLLRKGIHPTGGQRQGGDLPCNTIFSESSSSP